MDQLSEKSQLERTTNPAFESYSKILEGIRDNLTAAFLSRTNEAYRKKIGTNHHLKRVVTLSYQSDGEIQEKCGLLLSKINENDGFFVLADGSRYKVEDNQISPMSIRGEKDGEIANPITTRELIPGNKTVAIAIPEHQKDLNIGDKAISISPDMLSVRIALSGQEQTYPELYDKQIGIGLKALGEFSRSTPITKWPTKLS